MNLTKSFPPVDALIEVLQEVDYQKLYQDAKRFVIIAAAFVVAFVTFIIQKWQQYDCTVRLQLFVLRSIELAKTSYSWFLNVFVPEVKSFYDDCRSVYNFLRTV